MTQAFSPPALDAPAPAVPGDAPAAEEGRNERRGILDRVAFWIFCAMVALAPVPEGSVGLLWVTVWTGVAALVVLCASYGEVRRGSALIIGGSVVVLLAYGLLAWLQSVSPGPSPLAIWSEASQLLQKEIAPLSGSVRDAPLLFLGRPLLACLVLAAGIVMGSDTRRTKVLSAIIIGAACLYGVIGLVALLLSLVSLRPFDQQGALTAFFINRNTTATYLGSAFLIVFAWLQVSFRGEGGESRATSLLATGNRATVALAASGLLLLVLLPLTQSRAGFMLTIGVAAIGFGLRFRSLLRHRTLIIVGFFALFAFVYVVSGDIWRARQARLGLNSLGRLDVYVAMLQAAMDHPWLGLGLGSFAESFQAFRPRDLGQPGLFNIGHSTPIELIFEAGFPLAALVGLFALVCLAALVRGTIRRPQDPFILAAFMVALLGALHSSIDFSLQIPGYLIIYLAIVGMGIGRSFLPERVVVRRKRRSSSGETA
ncbi:O-antigen ligase family protein [Xanthobacter autotrophicus DSM 431]|uniref:O-antigen ligase family protein n=1 Tax=Xanthobacter nonsaccharivorans TaxID=3119912 RepID=UPI00372713E7